MPTERFSTVALAVGASSGNLMKDSKFLYAPGPVAVTVYCIADTALGQFSLTFGNVIECDRVAIGANIAANAGRGPVVNEDRIAGGVAMGGDQINISVFNASAAVMTIRTLVEIRPL